MVPIPEGVSGPHIRWAESIPGGSVSASAMKLLYAMHKQQFPGTKLELLEISDDTSKTEDVKKDSGEERSSHLPDDAAKKGDADGVLEKAREESADSGKATVVDSTSDPKPNGKKKAGRKGKSRRGGRGIK